MDFEFDDRGAVGQLATDLAAAGLRAGAAAHRITLHFGTLLQTRVKANASGRPGPRAQTGDYRRSIALRIIAGAGGVAAAVGTNRPQARRLEFGFKGTDARGRSYNQSAFPHFGPAMDQTGPEYQAAIAAIADGVLDAPDGADLPIGFKRDRNGRLRDSRGRYI